MLGVIPVIAALNMMTFLRAGEYWLAFTIGAIGVAILYWAWRIWRTPPRSRAEIVVSEDGISLSVRNLLNSFEHDIAWEDLREVVLLTGGYGARYVEFLLTHAGAEKAGLVRASTRESAPDALVRRKISVPIALLDIGTNEIIPCLQEIAEAHGYRIEKLKRREFLVLSMVHYSVTPAPDGKP